MTDMAVNVDEPTLEEKQATQLPAPSGYKILCAIPQLDAKYVEGGLIERPQSHDKREAQATVVLFVIALGRQCYTDKERYPTGPWCAEGDFIITRMYAGTRFTIWGKEFVILNEDQVEAVTQDPRGIGRS